MDKEGLPYTVNITLRGTDNTVGPYSIVAPLHSKQYVSKPLVEIVVRPKLSTYIMILHTRLTMIKFDL